MLRPLPDELDRAFTVTTALDLGVTAHRLRAPDLVAPTRGVRMVTEEADDLVTLLRAIQLGLPDTVAFSHLTAARIHGAPLPWRWVPDETVHIVSRATRMPVKRRGIVTHHQAYALVCERRGLRVVTPVTAWLQCGTALSVPDLVVMGDHLCRDEPQSLETLRRGVGSFVGRRGIGRLREAAELIRCGTASAPETLIRLWLNAAGLPEPALNRDVYDDTGGWIARPDLSWEDAVTGLKVAVEYDGDHHRVDRRQWQQDHLRDRALREAGWTLIVLTSAGLRHPDRVVELVATALGR